MAWRPGSNGGWRKPLVSMVAGWYRLPSTGFGGWSKEVLSTVHYWDWSTLFILSPFAWFDYEEWSVIASERWIVWLAWNLNWKRNREHKWQTACFAAENRRVVWGLFKKRELGTIASSPNRSQSSLSEAIQNHSWCRWLQATLCGREGLHIVNSLHRDVSKCKRLCDTGLCGSLHERFVVAAENAKMDSDIAFLAQPGTLFVLDKQHRWRER